MLICMDRSLTYTVNQSFREAIIIREVKKILAFYGAQTFITSHSARYILVDINIFFECVYIDMQEYDPINI
jgi:hypothetical protein